MSKGKANSSKSKKPEKVKKQGEGPNEAPQKEFGGIPERDLKKNLGCD